MLNVWRLTVVNVTPEVHVYVETTDWRLRGGRFLGGFLGSRSKDDYVANVLVKGWCFEIQFLDSKIVSLPVETVRVEAPTWSYDVIV